MYTKIMVPVDLEHSDKLGKALTTAADLAKAFDAQIYYVGVTATTPGPVAHTPSEFEEKLEEFARQRGAAAGVEAHGLAYASHDPTVDLDKTLNKAIEDTGCDLVVMASHVPGFPEHLIASNAGYLAQHAKVSVFVVR